MSEDTGWIGLISTLVNRHLTQKELKRVQQENIENQGIIRYLPSDIEAFFEDSDSIGNMLFSGGDCHNRIRAICRSVECALINNYHIIILHCLNEELEKALFSIFGNRFLSIINENNKKYDPFYGKEASDISQLVIRSATKPTEIDSVGKYYLDAMGTFIEKKGIIPYFQMYLNCPHENLVDLINEAESLNKISGDDSQLLLSMIRKGESERGNIENYFSVLKKQTNHIACSKNNLNRCTNVADCTSNNRILCIDINSSINTLLVDLIMAEIEQMMYEGKRYMLVLDGISITTSEALTRVVKNSSSNCNLLLSANDVCSLFVDEENLFNAYLSKCSKLIISRHISSISCQKFSDFIGTYDKNEFRENYSQNANYIGRYSLGSAHSTDVSKIQEKRVKPEMIKNLSDQDVFIIDNKQDQIIYTTVK